MNYINQMEPLIEKEERDAVNEYMASGAWITEHVKTKQFAAMVAEYTGVKYGFILSNGTVTLTTALWACGVEKGDEVLVPDYTMVASANAAILMGCEIRFVDIRRENLCMDFDLMVKSITRRTKAVILVTINGRYPENIESFVEYCKQNGIALIEDAAQSLGSFYKGKHLGTFGDVGSFSFSMPKNYNDGTRWSIGHQQCRYSGKNSEITGFWQGAPRGRSLLDSRLELQIYRSTSSYRNRADEKGPQKGGKKEANRKII